MVVRVSEKIDGDLNGSGSIEYIGTPTLHVSTHGSGRIDPAKR